MGRFIVIILFSFAAISCSKDDVEHEIIDFEFSAFTGDLLLYSDGMHNAFTDLCVYHGQYYLCFRNSNVHHPLRKEDYGRIFLYKSEDGNIWTKIGEVCDPDADLRDPKLTVDKQDRLILYCGFSKVEDNELIFQGTKAGVVDISDYTLDLQVIYNNLWLWRITWQDGEAYSFAYDDDKVRLLKSDNGFDWSEILGVEFSGCNESALYFLNKKGYVIMRTMFHKTLIGHAEYPYQNWTLDTIPLEIHSPSVLCLEGKVYCAGRFFDRSGIFTGLAEVNGCVINPIWYSPYSAVDQGYPGIGYKDGEVILSYYRAEGNVGDIFLKKFIVKPVYGE